MCDFISSLSGWDWLDITGLMLVLVGVVGEIWSARKHNEFWESIWGYVLIGGLALELFALPHHIVETSKLNKEAGEARQIAANANERASSNALRVAELDSTNRLLSIRIEELRSTNLVLQKDAILTQSNVVVLFLKNEQTSNTMLEKIIATSNSLPSRIRVLPNGTIIIR